MQMMDEILADKTMDRLSRIDKLEAILSAATQIPNEQVWVIGGIDLLVVCCNLFFFLYKVYADGIVGNNLGNSVTNNYSNKDNKNR
jgi:hypothetical protein